MIRKAILVVLTLAAVTTGLAWVSSYRLQLNWSLYSYKPLTTVFWMTKRSGEPWKWFKIGDIGRHAFDHVRLSGQGGTLEIYSQRQLPQPAKRVSHGFDLKFLSYRDGLQRTRERAGFHQFRRFRSTFAVPFVILSTYPTLAFIRGPLRRRRRRRKGLCLKCGYDLTGNVSGVCPECGTPIIHPDSPPE